MTDAHIFEPAGDWTLEADGYLLRLWSTGLSVASIARAMRRLPHDVGARIREHGLTAPCGLDAPSEPGHEQCRGIARIVAHAAGIPATGLFTRTRAHPFTAARQVAMALAAECACIGPTEIGRIFGGRDHSTVIHAMRTVRQEAGRDTPRGRLYRDAAAVIRQEMGRAA